MSAALTPESFSSKFPNMDSFCFEKLDGERKIWEADCSLLLFKDTLVWSDLVSFC